MSRIAVVGGTGFVGSHLCRQAVRRGWSTVISISRRGDAPRGTKEGDMEWRERVRWEKGDCFDQGRMQGTASIKGVCSMDRVGKVKYATLCCRELLKDVDVV
eukprot:Sspe_Gene.76255::Locus_47643_Transcript_1_1_Confidence_1.000_Length_376::g.76255::m.76255